MTALVVVTLAAESADSLARQLSAAGLQVGRWPLVRLIPAAPQTLDPVLKRLADFDWVLLPSPSAVRLVARRMKDTGIEWPVEVRAGLVGPSSVEAFRDCFGHDPRIDVPVGPPHDAGHLIEMLLAADPAAGTMEGHAGVSGTGLRALVLNRPDGRTHWLEALRRKAQSVEVVAAYTAEATAEGPPGDLMWRLQRLQRDDGPVRWVIGSSSQVDTLLRALPDGWAAWARRQPVLVPHAAVASHARREGFGNAQVYQDRRDLVERLQYLGNISSQAPTEPADCDAADCDDDNEEVSVLTLDQQKDTAAAGAKPARDQASHTGVDETKVGDVAGSPAAAAIPIPAAPSPVAASPDAPAPKAMTAQSADGPTAAGPHASGPAASTSAAVPTAAILKPAAPAAASPSAAETASARPPTASPTAASPAAASPAVPSPSVASPSVANASVPSPSAAGPATPSSSKPGPLAGGTRSAGPAAANPAASPASSPRAATATPNPVAGAPSRMSEPPPPAPPTPAGTGRRRGGGAWPLLLLLLVGLLAAGGWWYMQQGFLAAERQGAQRVQEAEARAAKLEEQIKALRDSQGQLQSRSAALEAKIAQSATQQEQLSGLYEEIARARGEGALAEVEQSVVMANQHLELTGNVQAALLALQNAERRLGESEQAQASAARRIVAQDIERLKALPDVDLTGSAARLDDVVNRVDRLPLLADAEGAVAPAAQSPAPAQPSEPPPPSAVDPGQASPATDDSPLWQRIYARALDMGARGIDMVREEFHSLVTIRRIDKPDSLLLTPEQKQAARDNLKLLLLNARLNLLNRHEDLFRKDLARAIDGMQRLFDVEQQDVKTAIAALQSLQAQPLALNLPSLAESLGAVRAARAASEKRS